MSQYYEYITPEQMTIGMRVNIFEPVGDNWLGTIVRKNKFSCAVKRDEKSFRLSHSPESRTSDHPLTTHVVKFCNIRKATVTQ